MSTFKSRLKEFISALDMNASGFSVALGYDSPEKIYRLLRDEKNKPSLDIIQAISNKFVTLNIDWLLNGRGGMWTKDLNNEKGKPYPKDTLTSVVQEPDSPGKYSLSTTTAFYTDYETLKVIAALGGDQPCFFINEPAYIGCSIERYHASTLGGDIPKGSWLFVTKIEQWHAFLEYGLSYMVILTDGRKLFYRIVACTDTAKLGMQSSNLQEPVTELDKKFIESIWLIKGYLPAALVN